MVTPRRGTSSLGCLFGLLVIVAAVYFGVNFGKAYWRFYEFQDDMRQEVRFASHSTNDAILAHLRASADSLALPPEAARISIRRYVNSIAIEADYTEFVEFPMYVREISFHPHAEGPL